MDRAAHRADEVVAAAVAADLRVARAAVLPEPQQIRLEKEREAGKFPCLPFLIFSVLFRFYKVMLLE